jgi:nicotinamidase-related amidase
MPYSPESDLHGNVPDQAPACLLIIDMINPFTFDGAQEVIPAAAAAAARIADLKRRIKSSGLPAVYVNDNFGKWQSDFQKLVDRCLQAACRGKKIVEMLRPEDDDYFVLKPKHSGFYATPLELLLRFLGARQLILTGIVGNSCVLHTASDAHMREYELMVPADCLASASKEDNAAALDHMRRMLKADTRSSEQLTWSQAGVTAPES